MSILWRHQILQLITEKRSLVSENPPATTSGVNSIFPEKVIMDLRKGITCEVLMGYERNLVVRTPMEI